MNTHRSDPGFIEPIDPGSRNDVEKRWRDPQMFRAAVTYVVIVIALTGVALAATAVWRSQVTAVMVPGVLFLGGVGAFIRTYRVWRAEGVWVIWQAAGWFLLMLFLFFLGVPFANGQ
ncbi:MAG: hypothetical protein O3A42_12260 [Actinobacteria bacterium]|nr:hypothetical protein [Actinomycetota bacterium]